MSPLAKILLRSRNDPDWFNDHVLRRKPYWSRQKEICRSVVDYRITCVYSGNAIGKDYVLGGLVPWWGATRHESLAIVTGPSQTLLGSVTWKEIRRAIEGSPILRKSAKISSGIKTSPQVVKFGEGWQALGYSTTNVERASGQHAGQLLVVGEEASGIKDEIYDAIDSLKYTRLLLIGNPLRAEGRFVDLIRQAERDSRDGVPKHLAVNAIQISSHESPHAELEHSPYGLADRTFLADMARRYGKDSLWYRCHILAEIPKLSHELLIDPLHLDACTSVESHQMALRLRQQGKAGRRRITCDVGEGCGNARTVVFVLDDLGVLEIHASQYTSPRGAAEVIGRLATKWDIKEDEINYDGAGQTGKRIGNALSALGLARSRPYFGASSGGKRCTNLRTATAMAFARRIDPDHFTGRPFLPFHVPITDHWQSMREELLALRYQLAGDKSALENKEDMADRLGRSPDFADSLCQGFRREAVEG